ncbi:MAG: SDR family NAD(P)-dependent oxidoreductase [Leptolyngbyaceae cyanobacterium MO_188.B28]|nr:SDR family NAD(P)-dependent oxidoreductase [Leptolyngbyaceae cyanobacterium MO_188.B28]
MIKSLEGKVALVTGATRGVGKGTAIGLGEAGATVYVTGRTLASSDGVSGSLQETQTAVEAAGGICVPVQVDHGDDEQVRSLFERIAAEQNGQLDLLVNNAYTGVQALTNAAGKPFWKAAPEFWDACNNVGLRSHYVASVYAARLMSQRRQGLICTISSWGSLAYIFGVPYGVGKAACDRLAADMSVELKPYNVASVSVWPGIVGTEAFKQLAAELQQSEDTTASTSFWQGYNWETPLLTGRAIAALASDPAVLHRTGRVQIVAELAERYRLADQDGNRPVSLRSMRFFLPMALPRLQRFPWLTPNLKAPWWMIRLWGLSSPKI